MSKFWLAVKDGLEAISYFFVVVGILFGVVQYLTFLKTNRQQIAVSYILEFQADEMVQARLNLQRHWYVYPVAAISGKIGSSDVIDQLAMSFIFPGKKVQTDDLVRVVDFLDLIGACVRESVCDEITIHRHFGTYSRNLYCLYQAPLERLRKEYILTHLGLAMRDMIIANQKVSQVSSNSGVNCSIR